MFILEAFLTIYSFFFQMLKKNTGVNNTNFYSQIFAVKFEYCTIRKNVFLSLLQKNMYYRR